MDSNDRVQNSPLPIFRCSAFPASSNPARPLRLAEPVSCRGKAVTSPRLTSYHLVETFTGSILVEIDFCLPSTPKKVKTA